MLRSRVVHFEDGLVKILWNQSFGRLACFPLFLETCLVSWKKLMIETWNIPVVKLFWKIEVNKEVYVNLNELLETQFLLFSLEPFDNQIKSKGTSWAFQRWSYLDWYTKPRWWFEIFFYVHPYLGKVSNLTDIFQMGWNHQLERFLRWLSVNLVGCFSWVLRMDLWF